MSEPEAAFLKLEIARPALVKWLGARPSAASRWNDWRDVGGRWHVGGATVALADAPQAALDGIVQGADATLAAFADNRELLHRLLRWSTEAPEPRIAAFDERGGTFVAGTAVYAEGIGDFIVFLALARSAADHLQPSGHGLAIVHNYLFGGPSEQVTTAALGMMPSGGSRLLAGPERAAAAPAFQSLVDALVDGRLPDGFTVRDQLPLLR